MQPRRMDPLLREMCKFYDELWRENNPGEAHLMPKSTNDHHPSNFHQRRLGSINDR